MIDSEDDDDDDDYNDESTFERPKSKCGGDCQMICIPPKEEMMMKELSISDIFTTNFWHAQMEQITNFWLLLLLVQPKQERKKERKQASKQSHLN
jgi:hypothetical protein